jgi:iron complex outermembrane recepter protein
MPYNLLKPTYYFSLIKVLLIFSKIKIREILILTLLLYLGMLVFLPRFAFANKLEVEADIKSGSQDFMQFSLEELTEITITSVSKKKENLFSASSAVYVITQEDIRRSGVTAIPELLRMVPGMQVARLNTNTWAVSTRGSNSKFANKLQVLIDGRTTYSSLFSGVFWDEIDLVPEDIDRIEVIRGSGGTLWGANAVNGVINIMTKNSKETLGGLVSAGVGDEELGFGTFRYGEKVSSNFTFNVFSKYFNRDDSKAVLGDSQADSWEASHSGFRMDWDASETSSLMVQGKYYTGRDWEHKKNTALSVTTAENVDELNKIMGGHFLVNWKKILSPDSDLSLQFYYNRQQRESLFTADPIVDTYDLEFQHRFPFKSNHEIIWGWGQRYISDSFNDSFITSFAPDKRFSYLLSAFIQDEIELIPKKLRLTLGTKLEVNNYTGFEYQPNIRASYTPDSMQTFWGAISRSVRTPSRSEDSVRFIASVLAGPTLIANVGNSNLEAEDLLSFELGYRFRTSDNFSLELSGFYNFYDDLLVTERGTGFIEGTPAPSHTLIPVTFENNGNGEFFGAEISATWKVNPQWTLKSGFSYLHNDLSTDPVSTSTTFSSKEGLDAETQYNISSYLDLPYDLELDSMLYFVNSLHRFNTPSYTRLDLRIGWNPTKKFQLSFSGQNLLDPDHPEFESVSNGTASGSLIQRSFYLKGTWNF